MTSVKVYPLKKKAGNLLANVDITFNDVLVCRGFKIIEGSKGNFVSKPSNKGADDNYYDMVYLLEVDDWNDICSIILDEYEEVIG